MTGAVGRKRSTGARPTDDQLLDAACRVFARAGVAGTTMNAVADEADSTKPTLYAHFGDKDSLYLRVLEREAETCRAWLVSAYDRNAELGVAEQAEADMMAFFDYAGAHADGFVLLFTIAPTARSSEIEQTLLRSVTAHIALRIRDQLGADATEFMVDQLAAMLVGVAVSAAEEAIRGDRDLRAAGQFAAAFASCALTGLDSMRQPAN